MTNTISVDTSEVIVTAVEDVVNINICENIYNNYGKCRAYCGTFNSIYWNKYNIG